MMTETRQNNFLLLECLKLSLFRELTQSSQPHLRALVSFYCYLFTVIFYCYLLLLSFTVIVFGFSLQVMRTRQDGAMVKQDLFETTKYYQGQPWSHNYLHYLYGKRQISVWAASLGCISCGILVSGIGARGVSSEHMENMEMFSCSPT